MGQIGVTTSGDGGMTLSNNCIHGSRIDLQQRAGSEPPLSFASSTN
jgi:hypothetical protein